MTVPRTAYRRLAGILRARRLAGTLPARRLAGTLPARRLAGTLLAVGALTVLPASSSAGSSLNQLGQELSAQHARQSQLASSLSGLSGLISSLSAQIGLVQQREAALSADLARDQAVLATTQVEVQREQTELTLLRARLARARTALSHQLVSSYETGSPDLVDVVLESHGFADLIERIQYLGDAEHQQQRIIVITRLAKARANAAAARLTALRAAEQRLTDQTAVRMRAVAGMNSLLQSRRSSLASAQALQQSALAASRSRSSQLNSQISQLEAQQAASYSAGGLGAGAGWAIPYAIVLCESGGQNLPPNSAGASGYYQILPSTWSEFGGTGPAAYEASKSEQDAVASRIWNGGAGASNWSCAAIVGIH
jgi:peptidoglycan hydrolase CwlO-like protein